MTICWKTCDLNFKIKKQNNIKKKKNNKQSCLEKNYKRKILFLMFKR